MPDTFGDTRAMARGRSFPALMAALVIAASAVLLQPQEGHAISNGLVPVPPMGTNPFGYNELQNGSSTSACRASNPYPDSGECQIRISQASISATANALVTPIPGRADGKSLADFGYDTVQLDGEWQGPRVGGLLIPNPREFNHYGAQGSAQSYTGSIDSTWISQYGWTTTEFKNYLLSIEATCSGAPYNHCLKVGIYDDWGSGINCSAGPGLPSAVADWAFWTHTWGDNGLWGHEGTDAGTFHDWGVSYVKIDTMCTPAKLGGDTTYTPSDRPTEWGHIRDAFAAYNTSSRPIALDFYWYGDASAYSNIWRLGGDLTGSYDTSSLPDFTSYLENLDRVDAYARRIGGSPMGPGNRNDFDNLLFSGTTGLSGYYLSATEERAVFGLEVLETSQLFIGADIQRLLNDSVALAILTNQNTINVDQDHSATTGDIDVGICVEAQVNPPGCPAPATLTTDPSQHTAWGGGNWEVLSKVLLVGPGTRAVGLVNRSSAPQDITFHASKLRTDSGSTSGGLQSVQTVVSLWDGDGLGQGYTSFACTPDQQQCTAYGVDPDSVLLLKVTGVSQ